MAQIYTAHLMRDHIPVRAALQAGIKALGFKLTIEDDYIPFVSSGYLPCTLDGEDAGLSIRFIDSQTMADKNAAIILKSGGDAREETTILMIAAALASGFGAVVQDKNDIELTAEKLIAAAEEAFAALD